MQVVLLLVFSKVVPLLSRLANVVPAPDSKVPLRPPGAFAVSVMARFMLTTICIILQGSLLGIAL